MPPTPLLETWLAAHPALQNSIVWLTPSQPQVYSSWSANQKQALQEAFVRAWTNQPSGLPLVPTNLSPDLPDEYPATVMTPAEAWAFYLAHLGQCLALEIGQRLTWSILKYTPEQLAILLDSREWFLYDASLSGYRIGADTNGYYTPAPPELILSFLTQLHFLDPLPATRPVFPFPRPNPGRIGRLRLPLSGQYTAIVHLFDWCRRNLIHFGGGFTTANMKAHWQYHGYPPLARVIEGTQKTGSSFQHWTAGCTGTVGFLRGILRAVNIPVKHLRIAGHSLPYFVRQRTYLSHGDDLYGSYSRGKYKDDPLPYPSEKLFLSQATFDKWFNPQVSPADKNIARRSRELAIEYLPIGLLFAYCKDKTAGVSHAEGTVFGDLKYYYTLAELEQGKLWERMEAKITQLGGCAANPPSF